MCYQHCEFVRFRSFATKLVPTQIGALFSFFGLVFLIFSFFDWNFKQFCGYEELSITRKVLFVSFSMIKIFSRCQFFGKFLHFSSCQALGDGTACCLSACCHSVFARWKTVSSISIFRLQLRMNKVCDNDSDFRFWRISFFWIKITARCSVTKPARCPSRRTLAVRTLHQPNKARSVSWEEGLLRKAFMDTTCWMLGIAEESFRLARCDTASAESIRPLILRYKFTQLLFFESKSAPGASYAEVRLGSLFHTAQGL